MKCKVAVFVNLHEQLVCEGLKHGTMHNDENIYYKILQNTRLLF